MRLTGGAELEAVLHGDGLGAEVQDDARLAAVSLVGLHQPHNDVTHLFVRLVQYDTCQQIKVRNNLVQAGIPVL